MKSDKCERLHPYIGFDFQKLVRQKNETMEKVSYIEAAQLYDSKLETALSVGLSALALALPAGYDIFKFSRKRYRERKMGKVRN